VHSRGGLGKCSRCFQVIFFSREAGCEKSGKFRRERRPITITVLCYYCNVSAARGDMHAAIGRKPRVFRCLVFEIALFCTRFRDCNCNRCLKNKYIYLSSPPLPARLHRVLMSIPVLRVNTGTTCMCVREQLQQGRCDRTEVRG
jgi:hypothetical protein